MYNNIDNFTTSGSMYEQIEAQRNQKIRKRKIMRKRIIVITIITIILLYLGLFLIDTGRFSKGEKPLITTNYLKKEYDDGKVETYYSLGWIFRYYTRETINKSEIAPFWKPIEADDQLYIKPDDDLPEVETGYRVPDNISKKRKVEGVLFFFYKEENLLGTYKCILSNTDCDITYSEVLDEDKVKDNYIPMDIIEDRYAFITEYKNKGTQAEEVHYYLFDIKAKHLIAEYQGVRYTTVINPNTSDKKGEIDSSRYIVKKNDAWGIDEVIKGRVNNFEEYKYKYITYDEENKLYIFKNKNDEWIVMNANNRVYTKPIEETIDSLYYKNDKIYMVAYI